MRNTILILIVSFFTINSFVSQTKNLGRPLCYSPKINLVKHGYKLPEINNQEQLAFYTQQSKLSGEKLMQYGVPHEVNLNVFQEAQKITLPNGNNLYQFMIESSSALSLNVIFNQFKLAEGTIIYLFTADKSSYIGAYTSLNNNEQNVLGTELLYFDKIIIEIQEPKENENKSKLNIGSIIHGFINLDDHFEKALNESGNCNIDVNCPQGSGWEIPRNSVVMLVNGTGGFCSGAMVNNTSGVLIPYLLTARHCGLNPGSWVFRFRWESPHEEVSCVSNSPSGNGPENMNINGGITRSQYDSSDFHLIELNSAPDPNWNVIYSGWDKSGTIPSSGAGIHHPSGDVKKISISSNPYESVPYLGEGETHWKVNWSEGVTEAGSSGSPIFDQNRRIVGQLQGGASGCGSSDQIDIYGKFSRSWIGGGSDNTRLSNWLDPSDTGTDFINANVTNSVDPFLYNHVIGLENTLCSGLVQPKIILINGGTTILTTADINYSIDGEDYTFNWTGNLGLYESDTITLNELNLVSGTHQFTAEVLNPNGSNDQNLENNFISKPFQTIVGGTDLVLTMNLDCYADETSWKIVDQNSTTLFQSPFYEEQETGYTMVHQFCLEDGCYDFIIYDSWGDGLSSTNCVQGSYSLTDMNDNIIVELPESEANFGASDIKNFCIGQADILDNLVDSKVLIYPNPFSDEINIEASETIKQIEIIDVTGKIILKIDKLESQKYVINHKMNSGIYFLKIKIERGIIIEKIYKK